ncbi:hypothetical protein HMPREF9946_01024 [Acetobacteraceae bacterium AT-5844]|nr:hypothetical protein HMPREF9946_01024 [Acetobacteraceae bacterium AT-5844]
MAWTGGRLWLAAFAGVLHCGAVTAGAEAQSLRDVFRAQARATDYAAGFQALSIFGGTPGISAANYNGEKLDIDSYKIPISHRFGAAAEGVFAGWAPYVELTLSYLRARQNTYLGDGPTTPHYANLSFHSLTALAGAGIDVPLGERTWFRPLLLGGYSRGESDTDFLGPNGDLFEAESRGILTDVKMDSILLGFAVALVHERRVWQQTDLTASLRFNRIDDLNYSASDRSLESNNRFSITTGSVEMRGPTNMSFFGRDVRWIAYGGGTWMMGRHRNALGFNSFAELGVGVELVDGDLIRGVEGVSIRSSALVGGNVTGWSLGLSISF